MKVLPFKIPEKVEIMERKNGYGKFLFAPLEPGFGITIGNTLRRTLLSSIQGSAISAVRIDGVLHEFSTIPGIHEDVPQIILNLKRVRIKLLNSLKKTFYLKIKKKKEVQAGDIETDGSCKIINPKQRILTVTDSIKGFTMELTVTSGRGYVQSEALKEKDAPAGTVFIDAFYSPVVRVNYKVERTRVERRTDYDKLILEIWTNGEMAPEDAVALGSMVLRDYFNPFYLLKREKEFKRLREMDERERELRKVLAIKLSDLELSVRSANCLGNAEIGTLEDLIKKTETQMLQYPNFGRKSLSELVNLLKKYNLSFGMDISKIIKTDKEEKVQTN
jgi:DNA-directed RNA polymerase subunit alpha